jgi:Glycosyl hydrolases family 2, TIM barrel domain/Glycosyl hydrolases family 2, sugar binding domain/Glycosyl hydrolases family 2
MRPLFFSLLFSLLFILPEAHGDRVQINLDGKWHNAIANDIKKRPLKWKSLRVPDLRMHPRKSPVEWYEREFKLKSIAKGFKHRLHFGQVNYIASVYINAKKVTVHVGGYIPFAVDITNYLKTGTNKILVIAENIQSLNIKNASSNANLPSGQRSAITVAVGIPDHERIVPVSAQGNKMRNWGLLGHVYIDVIPDVHINDIFVKPDVKAGQLDIQVEIENSSAQLFKGFLQGIIALRSKEQKSLPQIPVILEAGAVKTFVFKKISGTGLKLWWPKIFRPLSVGNGSPVLYDAELILLTKERTKKDELSQYFGYRQMWIENKRFVLNGLPIRLMGTSAHFGEGGMNPQAFYDKVEASGANIVRLHSQPKNRDWYELADKRGILLCDESAIGLVNGIASANQVFWKNCKKHLEGLIKAHRKYPSIVLWSIENEMGLDGKGKITDTEVKKLYRHALNFDKTRLFQAEGDTDLDIMPIVNVHCWWDYKKTTYPECFFWYERLPFYPNYRSVKNVSFNNKPLFIGEYSTEWCDLREDHRGEPAIVLGNDAYKINRNERFQNRGEITKKQTECYRWQGIAAMSPFTIFETRTSIPGPYSDEIKKSFRPIALLMREENEHFYSGSSIARTIKILNDSADTQRLELNWQATGKNGKIIASGISQKILVPGEIKMQKITFQAPLTDRIEKLNFKIELRRKGKIIDKILKKYMIFSKKSPVISKLGIKLLCYGANPETIKKINSVCPGFISTSSLTAKILSPHSIVIIAPDAAQTIKEEERVQLNKFVQSGGTVICLEQQADSLVPNLFWRSSKHSINFITFPVHEIWQYDFKLRDSALRYWKEGCLTRKMFSKPTTGNFEILTSGGFDMNYTSLVSSKNGKGLWLACQLSLIEQFNTEPIAREILYRILKYAIDFSKGTLAAKTVNTAVFTNDKSLLNFLQKRQYKKLEKITHTSMGKINLLITTGKDINELTNPAKNKLSKFITAGGTLYIHGLSKNDATKLSWLLPVSKWRKFKRNQVVISDFNGILAGLTAADFYWCSDYYNTRNTSRNIGETSTSFKGVIALTTPPLLSIINKAKGKIIVDQLLWLKTNNKKAGRIGNTLFNNLGIAFNNSRTKNNNQDFFCVNLDKFVNRTFRDSSPGDGDNGWTDQGKNDLRSFTAGKRVLRNIPFDISSRKDGMGIIISGNKKLSGKFPAEVNNIPVNMKVKEIYFLQGAAWAHGNTGWKYIIHYKNGSQAAISVKNMVNVADWWNEPNDLAGAKVAWSGKNSVHEVSLYMQKWINPNPELKITHIDIKDPGKAVAFVLAITAKKYLPPKKSKPNQISEKEWDGFTFFRKPMIIKAGVTEVNITPWGDVGNILFHKRKLINSIIFGPIGKSWTKLKPIKKISGVRCDVNGNTIVKTVMLYSFGKFTQKFSLKKDSSFSIEMQGEITGKIPANIRKLRYCCNFNNLTEVNGISLPSSFEKKYISSLSGKNSLLFKEHDKLQLILNGKNFSAPLFDYHSRKSWTIPVDLKSWDSFSIQISIER